MRPSHSHPPHRSPLQRKTKRWRIHPPTLFLISIGMLLSLGAKGVIHLYHSIRGDAEPTQSAQAQPSLDLFNRSIPGEGQYQSRGSKDASPGRKTTSSSNISSLLPPGIPTPIAQAAESVVIITAPDVDAETTDKRGSGVIVDAKQGLVITARHVIEGLDRDFGISNTVEIHTWNGQNLQAKVIRIGQTSSDINEFGGPDTRSLYPFPPMPRWRMPQWGIPPWGGPREGYGQERMMPGGGGPQDYASDMALLQIQNLPSGLVAAPLATSSRVPTGSEAWTIGAPSCKFVMTPDNCGPHQLRQTSIVASPDPQLDELIVVQGAINPKTGEPAAPGMPGASGGGLFDQKGHLLGTVVMGNAQTEMDMPLEDQFAGAVPIESIRQFLQSSSGRRNP